MSKTIINVLVNILCNESFSFHILLLSNLVLGKLFF